MDFSFYFSNQINISPSLSGHSKQFLPILYKSQSPLLKTFSNWEFGKQKKTQPVHTCKWRHIASCSSCYLFFFSYFFYYFYVLTFDLSRLTQIYWAKFFFFGFYIHSICTLALDNLDQLLSCSNSFNIVDNAIGGARNSLVRNLIRKNCSSCRDFFKMKIFYHKLF
jgi:hypothetical protein